MNERIYEKIKVAKECDKRVDMTISDKLVKLVEEVGEIGAAHLKERLLKPMACGETMEDVRANKKEEYADALTVIFDLILCDGFTFEEVAEQINVSVQKWYDKVFKIRKFNKGDIVKCLRKDVEYIIDLGGPDFLSMDKKYMVDEVYGELITLRGLPAVGIKLK